VKEDQISCVGEDGDHPKVYYSIPESGFVVCGYCNIKYMREDLKDSINVERSS